MFNLSGQPRDRSRAKIVAKKKNSKKVITTKVKKKYSMKEGSTFEDLGIIAFLHQLITSTDKSTGNLKSKFNRYIYMYKISVCLAELNLSR